MTKISPAAKSYLKKYRDAGPKVTCTSTIPGERETTQINTTYSLKERGTWASLQCWRAFHVGVGVGTAYYSCKKILPSAAITGAWGAGTNATGLHGWSIIPWTITGTLLVCPALLLRYSYKKFRITSECLSRYTENPYPNRVFVTKEQAQVLGTGELFKRSVTWTTIAAPTVSPESVIPTARPVFGSTIGGTFNVPVSLAANPLTSRASGVPVAPQLQPWDQLPPSCPVDPNMKSS